MSLMAHMAKQIRDVYNGGNWTSVNFKDQLADITWQQANRKIYNFNTIVALVYHVSYYVSALIPVLQGGSLNAHDKYSFDHPPIRSQKDWEEMVNKTWSDAEILAVLIEQLPESKLWEDFFDIKYGSYYRNIQGIIEHNHYHLGQIVLIKEIIQQTDENT